MSKPDYSEVPMTTEDDPEDEQTNEDICCEALAETLHYVELPVIVGLYAEWGRNKRGLLDKIKKGMTSRSEEQEDGKGGGRNGSSLLSLIWRIIFYLPVLNSTPFERVRYIFLNFDAWEYVGCDHIWAGIVTTLLDKIEEKNKILFSVVRAFGGEPEPRTGGKRWVSKKRTKTLFWCYPGGFIGLILCYILVREFADNKLLKTMGYMTLGGSAFAAMTFPFMRVFKYWFCIMKKTLQNDMNRKDLSLQLGFMHSVKKEVKNINNFFRFKALKENREIRVVLNITNLDRCSPDKVVAVLDAINILLCDRNPPFICILAADPSILVEAIQWSSNTWNNGYLYLDRIVSLPFSLPPLSWTAKSHFLKTILRKPLEKYSNIHSDKECCAKSDKNKLLTKKELLTKKDMEHISSHLQNKDRELYIPGNSIQMKRVVNTVLFMLTMIKMGFRPKGRNKMKLEKERIKQIIDWIVLAHFWPCRLSWILQCVEDEKQQKSSGRTSQDSGESTEVNQQGEISEKDRRGLLEIFDANAGELDKMKYKIQKLLELDGDPDLFRIFLEKDHFTVGWASCFSDLLLNLDFSLKRRFELLRGLHNIHRENKTSDGSPPTEER